MKRRNFLQLGAAVAGAATMPFGAPMLARGSAPWGEIATGMGQYKILQIVCYGALSLWETFWVSELGRWHGLGGQIAALQWDHDNCANTPPDGAVGWSFGQSFDGVGVSFGPPTYPISPERRPDIFNRTRFVTIHPGLEVHRLALFNTLTGHRLGNARAAGLGAAIQRYHFERNPRSEPYSVVFAPQSAGFSQITGANPAVLRGMHPGYAQPLFVKVGNDASGFVDQLGRANVLPDSDALSDLYRRQAEDSLKFNGAVLPSRAYNAYDASLNSLMEASHLTPWFDNGKMGVDNAEVCGNVSGTNVEGPGNQGNVTRTSLQLAAHLLATGELQHACVFDRGVRYANGGAPYDTHRSGNVHRHTEVTCSNLFNLLDALASVVSDGEENGLTSGGLAKISLDDVLIVIQTEFTRAANPGNGDILGREHNGNAGGALLIAGPVLQRGIHGVIEEVEAQQASVPNPNQEDDPRRCPLLPADLHCGLLHAAGVNCLEPDNFSEADLGPAIKNSDGDIYDGLRSRVLGVQDAESWI